MFEGRGGAYSGEGAYYSVGAYSRKHGMHLEMKIKVRGGDWGSYRLCFSQYFASLTYQN